MEKPKIRPNRWYTFPVDVKFVAEHIGPVCFLHKVKEFADGKWWMIEFTRICYYTTEQGLKEIRELGFPEAHFDPKFNRSLKLSLATPEEAKANEDARDRMFGTSELQKREERKKAVIEAAKGKRFRKKKEGTNAAFIE